MARDKSNQANIDASDLGNYPNKRIRNNDGSGNGTPVNESVYGDIHEFHAKVMRDAKESYNSLPDNTTNGYQLYDSLMSLAGKNDLIKDIVKTNDTTLTIPVKISALKSEESLVFKSSFASTNLMNLIQGIDGNSKLLTIVGSWSANQFVRIINYNNSIQIVGLYDSQIVPNLASNITTIQNTFVAWTKIMSVFIGGGAMVFWNKPANEIPQGWQEVEDWRGRFPVGLDLTQNEFNVLPKIGGSKTVTLNQNQIPSVGFSINIGKEKVGTGNQNAVSANGGGAGTLSGNTNGGGQAHDNLPPYRTVLFIEYIG